MGKTILHRLNNTPQCLRKIFYIEEFLLCQNCIADFETEEQAIAFTENSQTLISAGDFDLRGWTAAPLKTRNMTKNQKILQFKAFEGDW